MILSDDSSLASKPPSIASPADWAPQSPLSKARYQLGEEYLAGLPVAFAISFAPARNARPSDFENDARVVWVSPASALWRVAERCEWASLCCQAIELDEAQLRQALKKIMESRIQPYGSSERAWSSASGGLGIWEARARGAKYSRGFAYAADIRFVRELSLSDQQKKAALTGALGLPEEWLGVGWGHWSPRSSKELGYGREPCALALESARRCQSAWEAHLISQSAAQKPAGSRRGMRV